MKRVVVHIDRLVMRGIRREDAPLFAQSLREQLALELAAPEIARQLATRGDVPRLQAADVHLDAGVTPAGIGARAASSIVSGVKS